MTFLTDVVNEAGALFHQQNAMRIDLTKQKVVLACPFHCDQNQNVSAVD
jgi:hypothetical protein